MQTNSQTLDDLNVICRVCLCKNDELKDVFSEKIDDFTLSDIFNSFTNFKVVKDDGFPNLMCDACTKKLEECYSFQKQIENSYRILQKWAENKDEKKIEILYELEVEQHFESDEDEAEEKESTPKKQTQRLIRVDYNEVVKAIEDSKKKFLENTLCIYCGFLGSNSRALAIHVSRLHKTAKERWCSHCNTEFPDLAQHTTTTHAQTDIKCQFCAKTFTSRGHLTEHLRSHTAIRPFKCTDCAKSFISARHLKAHARTHTNEQPYECAVCKKRFAQSVSLKKHLGTHAQTENAFTCSYCDAVFGDKNSLVVHDCTEKDLESPLNYCKRCKRKVKSLEVHLKRVHGDGNSTEKVVELELCTMCGRQFKTAAKLKIHMRIHTGEAPYKCSYCDKRMVTRNNLVVHERVHTGEKPHGCNVCGKRFSQWSVLNTHMRIHNGRPEVCTLCSKRFCRPIDLKLHMRRHTGEKPFLCVHCGQGFVQRSHLTEHTRIHSEERPFQCPYCEKAFKQNSSLKQHVDIHLGNKPFKCTQCPYACRQAYSLTQHMSQHAADQPLPDKPHVCLICRKSYSTIAMLISHTSMQHKANLLKVE